MDHTKSNEIEQTLKQELGDPIAPVVFEYDNYRNFLRDYYTYQKKNSQAFSLRFFCKRAGFRSPSFFIMVMKGERNLSDEGIEKFCKALDLTAVEADCFRNLVFFNQSETVELKQRHAQSLLKSKAFQHLRPLAKARFEYWSHWYNVAIRELVALPGFQEDPQWIASMMRPSISPDEARRSIEHLLTLGVLKRTPEGKLELTGGGVTTGDEVTNVSISHFHREMIQKAKESIDRFEKKDRQVSSVTVSLSEAGEEHIKAMMLQFRKEILAVANEHRDPSRVCQINLQLFPLTEKLP